MSITIECKNCGALLNLRVWPHIAAKLSGHPDSWCPAEGGEFEPEACPICNRGIDSDVVWDKVEELKREDPDL